MNLPPAEAPYFVCDLDRLREKLRAFRAAFDRRFPRSTVGYSYKTNYLPALCRCLHEDGAHAEVVSILEYRLARALGVAPAAIIYNGPGKRYADLAGALADGALVNLDSMQEVDYAAHWARGGPPGARLGLRVNIALPESAAGERSRFGIHPAELPEAARRLRDAGLRLGGLHAHLSTRGRGSEVFAASATALAAAWRAIAQGPPDFLDIGGGFGFADPAWGMRFPSFDEYATVIHDALRAGGIDVRRVALLTEPGISLVGDVMTYVAPVLAVKQVGERRLAVVDGSVHLVRPTRHRHRLPTIAVDADGSPRSGEAEVYDLVGYTCMEDDYLEREIRLPRLAAGDRVAIGNVGAYTFVFKPPFIRGAPPIWAIDRGRFALAAREQAVDDVFATYVR